MQTYLLDTCIWSYWWDTCSSEHSSVVRHADGLGSGSILGMSVVTVGEIEFGWQWVGDTQSDAAGAYQRFIQRRSPKLFMVDRHTATEYGRLKASLCERYMPRNERSHACRLSQLVDPVTSERLGVDENDLWITAQAIVRDLALITNDKLMRIREIAGDRLRIENWAI